MWTQSSSTAPLLALVVLVTSTSSSTVPTIQAPWGSVQGVVVAGDEGREMHGYLAIPYALPPVGDLRFHKPQPHPGPDQGHVFVADQLMPACPQTPFLVSASTPTSEDCLKLDVYVPPPAEGATGPYSVMVFIHGGGFIMGDAPYYRPSKLVVDGQVIVVAIQYRLGALGFLTSGDDVLPGNLGLWDQQLALRWVKDNIGAFGGDPDTVTIFGESAGSMSVGAHVLSPQSRGLFKRGIMQSGSFKDIDNYSGGVDFKQTFKDLATKLDCQGDTTQELVSCLQQQPAEEILKKSTEHSSMLSLETYFWPRTDGEFIPHDAINKLRDEQYVRESGIGDLDLILGFNNQEGASVTLATVLFNMTVEEIQSTGFFGELLSSCLTYSGIPKGEVVKKVLEFYYRGADAGTNNSVPVRTLSDMFGDSLMNAAIFDFASDLVASPHSGGRYVYVLDHDFEFNRDQLVTGSHHGDELSLEFDNEKDVADDVIWKMLNKTSLGEGEKGLEAKFVQFVTTFAKTGNPSKPFHEDIGGDWPQFTDDSQEYLSISNTPRVVQQAGPYRDRVALWRRVLPEISSLTSQLPVEEEATPPADPDSDKDEL